MLDKCIAIFSLNDKTGGAEQVLKTIAIYYIEKGYTVDVFFLAKHSGDFWAELSTGSNLIYTSSKCKIFQYYQLFKNVKNKRKKYTYGFTSHLYLNSFIGYLREKKIIQVENMIGRESISIFLKKKTVKNRIRQSVSKVGYTGLDLLICQTDEMKRQFVSNRPFLSQAIKICVIPNPVNLEQITSNSENTISDIVLGKKIIVAAGRFIKRKGFDVLIKAFSFFDSSDYLLVILGDGKERFELEKIVKQLNLNSTVLLPGFTKNVYPYFFYAEMCVVPSISEGFPNVLLQMMSQNTKVVSTLCAGGINEIEGLFTCESGNPNALYETMKECLSNRTERNRELFDAELQRRSIDNFISLIDEILKSKSSLYESKL